MTTGSLSARVRVRANTSYVISMRINGGTLRGYGSVSATLSTNTLMA